MTCERSGLPPAVGRTRSPSAAVDAPTTGRPSVRTSGRWPRRVPTGGWNGFLPATATRSWTASSVDRFESNRKRSTALVRGGVLVLRHGVRFACWMAGSTWLISIFYGGGHQSPGEQAQLLG